MSITGEIRILTAGPRDLSKYEFQCQCEWCEAILEVPSTVIIPSNEFDIRDGFMTVCPSCDQMFPIDAGLIQSHTTAFWGWRAEMACRKIITRQRCKEALNADGMLMTSDPVAIAGMDDQQKQWIEGNLRKVAAMEKNEPELEPEFLEPAPILSKQTVQPSLMENQGTGGMAAFFTD